MVRAPWSVRTPGSYISLQSIVLYFLSLDNNRLHSPQSPVRGYLLFPHLAHGSPFTFHYLWIFVVWPAEVSPRPILSGHPLDLPLH